MNMDRIAVVTGANKGIGYAIVRQLCKKFKGTVILTARDEQRGREACDKLKTEGLNPFFLQLDITSLDSIERFKTNIIQQFQGIDILINNAGTGFKFASTVPFSEQVEVACNTNFLGTLKVCRALFSLLKPHARVVNVSSGYGRMSPLSRKLQDKFLDSNLTEEELVSLISQFVKDAKDGVHSERGWVNNAYTAYSMSKIGVNALTRIQARQMNEDSREDILVNCCCPGWVQTDMGGPRASLTPDEGAELPVYLALLPPGIKQPQGAFYKNMKPVDWVTLQPLQ